MPELSTESREKAVLIHEHVFVERHVGYADGFLIAQGAIVAKDRHLVNWIFVRIQAAMPVVIANRIGGAEVGDPSGFEQWNQPGLVLAGDGHRPGDRKRNGAAHPDGPIENRVDAPQERAAKGRQAVPEQLVEGVALVHAANLYGPLGSDGR